MNGMRRLGAAAVMAAVVATGLGTATLEAAKKGGNGGGSGGGDGQAAICTYLKAVMDYQYTSPYVYVYAASLYSYYGCGK
jgi:hypothetical protein